MSAVAQESMCKYIYCLFWFKSMSLQSTERILPFFILFYFKIIDLD